MKADEKQKLALLLTAFMEGALSSEEEAHLNTLLKEDPEARALYFREISLAVEIKEFSALLDKSQGEPSTASHGRKALIKPKRRMSSRRGTKPLSSRSFHVVKVRPWYGKTATWLATAACALLVIGTFFYNSWQAAQKPYLIVASLTGNGTAFARDAEGGARQLNIRDAVYENEWIEAVEGSGVKIQYPEEDTVMHLQNGRGRFFSEEDGAKRGKLTDGVLRANVAPQPNPLQIRTPHALATVIGTSFMLEVEKTFTRLDVSTGRVRFESLRNDTDALLVTTGQYAVTMPRQATAIHSSTSKLDQSTEDEWHILFDEDWRDGGQRWFKSDMSVQGISIEKNMARWTDPTIVQAQQGLHALLLDASEHPVAVAPGTKDGATILTLPVQPGRFMLQYDCRVISFNKSEQQYSSKIPSGIQTLFTTSSLLAKPDRETRPVSMRSRQWYQATLDMTVKLIENGHYRVTIDKYLIPLKSVSSKRGKPYAKLVIHLTGGHVRPIFCASNSKMLIGRVIWKTDQQSKSLETD